MIIRNATNIPLYKQAGTLPNVGDAMLDYFQTITFITLVKSVVNFVVVESEVQRIFQGVWQPLSEQKIDMKPQGQRQWSWFWLHADPSLVLSVDDIIVFQGTSYRVDSKKDFTQYGYLEYHLVNDYTSGQSEFIETEDGQTIDTESGDGIQTEGEG